MNPPPFPGSPGPGLCDQVTSSSTPTRWELQSDCKGLGFRSVLFGRSERWHVVRCRSVVQARVLLGLGAPVGVPCNRSRVGAPRE